MLNSITFAGKNSADYGLGIEKFPSFVKPKRKYTKYSVAGRNGDLYMMQDAYENVSQEYEVWSKKGQWTDIIEWLYEDGDLTIEELLNLETNGYHQLKDTYDPDTIRLATFIEETEVENIRNRYGRATIRFDCRPERFTADAFDWINLENETPVAESTEPYLFKASPEADIEVDEIVGGSVGWNQLVTTPTFTSTNTDTRAYIALQFRNRSSPYTLFYKKDFTTAGIITSVVNVTETCVAEIIHNGASANQQYATNLNVISGHKYFLSMNFTGVSLSTVGGVTIKDIMLTDLTALFGSTIADYIYSLEQATAGAGVTWLKTHFPKMFGQYNAYDAGSIKSVEGVSAHKMVGKNLLPNTTYSDWTVKGSYLVLDNICPSNTRVIMTLTDKDTSVNTDGIAFGFLIGGYNGTVLNSSQYRWIRNANGSINSVRLNIPASGDTSIYLPSLIMYPTTEATYNAFFARYKVQIELGSTATAYEPYETWSYPLDSSVKLNGQFMLDSNNKLYCNGDVWHSVGQIDRKYTLVDLGTLNWNYSSSVPMFYASIPTPRLPANNGVNTTWGLSPKYLFTNRTNIGGEDKHFAITTTGVLCINDSAYTDAATFKTAMNGVNFVYEKATPTTESATPYQNPQRVGSTEEYVTDSIVPVGHNSKYYDNPFVNPTARTAKPCLKVYGSGAGTVYCNGTTITISDIPQYIYIDSDSQNCFKEISDANLNSLVSLSNGFPVLSAGDNSISWSGGVTNVEVMPRWWNL